MDVKTNPALGNSAQQKPASVPLATSGAMAPNPQQGRPAARQYPGNPGAPVFQNGNNQVRYQNPANPYGVAAMGMPGQMAPGMVPSYPQMGQPQQMAQQQQQYQRGVMMPMMNQQQHRPPPSQARPAQPDIKGAAPAGAAAEKLSTIQKLTAQLQQVKELQAKLQATIAKKKATGQPPAAVPPPAASVPAATSTNQKAANRQENMIENLSKHIRQLQGGQAQTQPKGAAAGTKNSSSSAASSRNLLASIPPSKWTVAQVLTWLDSVGFGAQRDEFSRQKIDGPKLLALSFADIQTQLRITDEGLSSRIIQAIAKLCSARGVAGGANGAAAASLEAGAGTSGTKRKVSAVDSHASSGGASRSSSSRSAPRQKRSRKRFAWIATIESWVLEHEMHCSSYNPGEKQTKGPEPNICCENLRNGAQYTLRVVPNSNKCCGVTDLIVLCNSETKKVVGSLPCSMTQFLAPLMQNDLIVLTGATTCVIHPEGGVPPFELALEGDLMRLAGLKRDPRFRMHIRKLTCLLDNWEGDWIDSDYPTNIESIKNLLSTD